METLKVKERKAKKNVPKLRFPEFEREWEINRIKDLLNVVNRPVKMDDDLIYSLVTVKRRFGGIVRRQFLKGKAILVKSQFWVKTGDFLISKRQIVHGACEMLPKELDDSIVSNEYLVLSGKENILIEFFNYYVRLPKIYRKFYLSSIGVHIEKMLFRVEDWFKWKIPIPSKAEQKKIAGFLLAVDKKIQQLTRKKELLAQYKKGVMQKIFSREIRFKDENGNDYPDWEEKRLGEIGNTNGGLTYSPSDIVEEGGTLVLRSSNIQDGAMSFKDSVYVDCRISEKDLVKENDILICVRNGSKKLIGKSLLIKREHEGLAFGAFMAIFRSDSNPFVSQFFKMDRFFKQIYQHLGATINQITGKSLNSFKIKLPSFPEQQKIAHFLSNIDSKIDLINCEITQAKKYKKGLLQQMFV